MIKNLLLLTVFTTTLVVCHPEDAVVLGIIKSFNWSIDKMFNREVAPKQERLSGFWGFLRYRFGD